MLYPVRECGRCTDTGAASSNGTGTQILNDKCQVTVKGRNMMFLAKREKVMFNGSAQWLYKNIYCINGND